MNIAIIGLGLIGGSLAKAIATRTDHTVYGSDISESVLLRAQMVDAIHEALIPKQLSRCNVVLLALFPEQTIQWLRDNSARLSPGTLVVDCGGIKQDICKVGFELAEAHGFTFMGGHPMAGIEKFGFAASKPTLFNRASMVLIPKSGTPLEILEKAKKFFLKLGFSKITMTTPEKHDQVIAYTSQLPHVISSAYIRSETAMEHAGLSAGSFKDLSRVATMQPSMWTELFITNKTPLVHELDSLMQRLKEYRDAIQNEDADTLDKLLEMGSEQKKLADRLARTYNPEQEA